jgi:oligoribonuclease NrnB/cAMP/cGMP phosphodiesterase (DHH superfamily)
MDSAKKPLVLYHARCADGAGAAFAAWCKFGEEAEYRAVLHGDPAPTDEEVRGRDIYILDFAYPYEDMQRIWRRTMVGGGCDDNLFYVIDHHVTTLEIFKGTPYPKPPYLIFDNERSGATLAWKYFHGDEPVPEILSYIEDKDLWRWKLPESREISAALEARGVRTWHPSELCARFTTFRDLVGFERDLISGAVARVFWNVPRSRLIDEGGAVLRAQNQYVDAIVSVADRVKLYVDNLTDFIWVYAANAPVLQSEVGAALAEKSKASGEAPVGIVWFRDGSRGNYRVSLRSVDGYDVSRIARMFSGGGGHRTAAGFECEKLPW